MILLRDCKNDPNKARDASHSFVESVYSETLHYSRLPHSVHGDATISDGHSNLSYETVRNVSEYYPRRTEYVNNNSKRFEYDSFGRANRIRNECNLFGHGFEGIQNAWGPIATGYLFRRSRYGCARTHAVTRAQFARCECHGVLRSN